MDQIKITDPLSKIASLAYIQDDWCGPGSKRPSEKAIKHATIIASHFKNPKYDVYNVDADFMGGIMLYVTKPSTDKHMIAICSNNGLIIAKINTSGSDYDTIVARTQPSDLIGAIISIF